MWSTIWLTIIQIPIFDAILLFLWPWTEEIVESKSGIMFLIMKGIVFKTPTVLVCVTTLAARHYMQPTKVIWIVSRKAESKHLETEPFTIWQKILHNII